MPVSTENIKKIKGYVNSFNGHHETSQVFWYYDGA